jgi:hypothetical protein
MGIEAMEIYLFYFLLVSTLGVNFVFKQIDSIAVLPAVAIGFYEREAQTKKYEEKHQKVK